MLTFTDQDLVDYLDQNPDLDRKEIQGRSMLVTRTPQGIPESAAVEILGRPNIAADFYRFLDNRRRGS